ncbi:uncharacterized protein LOC141649457 [Silene latifolia]|uniref:uncharacterized protein LOC141649457 n=1 Tax=Silene latifolia TaxID=37657 RepID=UPI003D76E595
MAAHFHPEGLFDHNPCIVSCSKLSVVKKASFKYFNMWGASPSFLSKVTEEWGKNYHAAKELEDIQKEIIQSSNPDLINAEVDAIAKLKELTIARNRYLSQKAKVQWLEEGDINTAYFHGAIKKRQIQNKVIQIEDQHGRFLDLQNRYRHSVCHPFSTIFVP